MEKDSIRWNKQRDTGRIPLCCVARCWSYRCGQGLKLVHSTWKPVSLCDCNGGFTNVQWCWRSDMWSWRMWHQGVFTFTTCCTTFELLCKYVCHLYGQPSAENVNNARYKAFCMASSALPCRTIHAPNKWLLVPTLLKGKLPSSHNEAFSERHNVCPFTCWQWMPPWGWGVNSDLDD